MKSSEEPDNRPSALAPFLELRALFEVVAGISSLPALRLLSPKGDGHPVATLPPFMSDDKFMSPMRQYLASLGYATHGWELGQNTGVDESRLKALAERVRQIAEDSGERVSVIGHSLGGIYARLLAHTIPDSVRQVIFLGSPFNITDDDSMDLPIRRIYEKLNPQDNQNALMASVPDTGPTPMPSTAIYSEGDGFVPWRFCMDEEDAVTENLRVPGSHTGMPFNIAILYAIADRLAQAEDDWQPFSMQGLRQCVYGKPSNKQ